MLGSTTKHPEAAYELFRWLAFSEMGLSAYMDALKAANENALPQLVNNNPAIQAKMKTFKNADEGWLYTMENIGSGFSQNCWQLLPDFTVVATYIEPLRDRVNAGEDVSGELAEVEQKATEAMNDAWVNFDNMLARVQELFDRSHAK